MSAPVVKPSATLILLRQTPEGITTVLLKRHEAMAFGSAWVFPGGKIDAEDYLQETSAFSSDKEREVAAAVHAAVRETREEAGVDIAPESLVLMSCWTTPTLGDRPRFRTWFFVAEMNHQNIVVDGKEMLDHRWLTLAEAVSQSYVREFGMLPPTYNTLLDILPYSTVPEALAALRQQALRVYNPKLLPMEGGFLSLYEGDAGYDSADPDLPGARHRLIVDHNGYQLVKS